MASSRRKMAVGEIAQLIIGSIARTAKRRHLSYSEVHFGVFRPAWATRYTDKGEIWRGGSALLHAKFRAHLCNDKGTGPQNWNFYWDFTKILNINAPQGRISLVRLYEIYRFCTPFQDALIGKIWMNLLKGFRSYRVLSWGGLVSPNFQRPLPAKLRRTC